MARRGQVRVHALHFTSNGTRVTPVLAERLAPRAGEIRLSAHDDTNWERALRTLTGAGCRVGVNVMVGPKWLGVLPGLMSCAAAAGACDRAVLRYVGEDDRMLASACVRQSGYSIGGSSDHGSSVPNAAMDIPARSGRTRFTSI